MINDLKSIFNDLLHPIKCRQRRLMFDKEQKEKTQIIEENFKKIDTSIKFIKAMSAGNFELNGKVVDMCDGYCITESYEGSVIEFPPEDTPPPIFFTAKP